MDFIEMLPKRNYCVSKILHYADRFQLLTAEHTNCRAFRRACLPGRRAAYPLKPKAAAGYSLCNPGPYRRPARLSADRVLLLKLIKTRVDLSSLHSLSMNC